LSLAPRLGEGNDYYFFWSLERGRHGLGLKTIAKKDWYEWGARILLANQDGDGGLARASTAAGGRGHLLRALLFLKRSNLTATSTTMLKGKCPTQARRHCGVAWTSRLAGWRLPLKSPIVPEAGSGSGSRQSEVKAGPQPGADEVDVQQHA